MDVSNGTILKELFRGMPSEHRAILCSVSGDPSIAPGPAWRGISWYPNGPYRLLPTNNNYVAISAFSGDPVLKLWKRRKENFAGLYAIMVDDVGTKIPHADFVKRIEGLPPSMVVETSPGNLQVTYFLDNPLMDQEVAEDGVRQLIAVLTGNGLDPGMSGVTRVLRLPVGINGKAKYVSSQTGQPWGCRLAYYRPDIRWTWQDIWRAFGLVERHKYYVEPDDAVSRERRRGFGLVADGLRALRIVKREGRGWIEIRCPWVRDHSDRADTGAAVAYPAKVNGYMGGFKCHHGHCADRGWGDLENWVMDTVIAEGQRRGHQ